MLRNWNSPDAADLRRDLLNTNLSPTYLARTHGFTRSTARAYRSDLNRFLNTRKAPPRSAAPLNGGISAAKTELQAAIATTEAWLAIYRDTLTALGRLEEVAR